MKETELILTDNELIRLGIETFGIIFFDIEELEKIKKPNFKLEPINILYSKLRNLLIERWRLSSGNLSELIRKNKWKLMVSKLELNFIFQLIYKQFEEDLKQFEENLKATNGILKKLSKPTMYDLDSLHKLRLEIRSFINQNFH